MFAVICFFWIGWLYNLVACAMTSAIDNLFIGFFCSSQPNSELHIEQNNAAMELINSVTGLDEEGRSRQRILTFAARR